MKETLIKETGQGIESIDFLRDPLRGDKNRLRQLNQSWFHKRELTSAVAAGEQLVITALAHAVADPCALLNLSLPPSVDLIPDWVAGLKADDRLALADFLHQSDLDSVQQLFLPIDIPTLKTALAFDPDFAQEVLPGSSTTIAGILEKTRDYLNQQIVDERLLNDALAIMQQHLPPGYVPQEPTQLIHSADSRYAYQRPVRGVHAIHLPRISATQPLAPIDYWKTVISLAHELAHQRHCEMVGDLQFNGYSADPLITDQEIANQPRYQLGRLAQSRRAKGVVFSHPVRDAVVEGFAVIAEQLLTFNLAQQASVAGDIQSAAMFHQIMTTRSQQLADMPTWKGVTFAPHTEGTLNLMRYLFNDLGPERFSGAVAQINLNTCRQLPIDPQDPKFKEIFTPTGWKKLPLRRP